MITDPIADMLTRLRNAQRVGKPSVNIPHSKVKESILNVLRDEGYIRSYSVSNNELGRPVVTAELKYYEGKPVIQKIVRCSKPGRRVYSGVDRLPFVANGLGINILSTSSGVMADSKARFLGIGGEIVCSVF